MNSTWFIKSGLVAIGLLSIGALITGCSTDGGSVPLYLYVDASDFLNEEIVVTLDNPTKSQLFVPESWTGLAVYEKLPTGGWVEHMYPGAFQPMVSTYSHQIEYSIPAGTLTPGSYRIVIQGRIGQEGTPFFLESDLDLLRPVGELSGSNNP